MKRSGAKDAEGESTSKTARSDSEDPFYSPYCESDVTLVVEGKKLHVHKGVLSVYSPVFGAMFTADFAEKDAKEIELPGKTYDAMLQFLLQMYPRHSYKAITGKYGAFYLRTQTKFLHYITSASCCSSSLIFFLFSFFSFLLFSYYVFKCTPVLETTSTTFQRRGMRQRDIQY